MNPGVHLLWPTPLGIFRMDDSQAFHADMLALVHAQMASQCEQRGLVAPPAFFASDDNLAALLRERAEGRRFLAFIADALQTLVGQANQTAWSGQAVAPDLQMTGMWFQCSRDGAFHDVHTHANCSWSAAYIVQIDPEELRVRHPVYGVANGVTRFYGPRFNQLAGAWVDLGNAYLLPPHVDVPPVPGQLVVFPAWLPHKAMPYAGTLDRVIISFNVGVRDRNGRNLLQPFGP